MNSMQFFCTARWTRPRASHCLRHVGWVLIALVLSLTLMAGAWLAKEVVRMRRIEGIAAEITKRGGSVYYDWETDRDGNVIEDGLLIRWSRSPPAPRFLRALFGENLFAKLTSVDFEMCRADPRALAYLSYLPDLKHLSFWSGHFREEDAEHLARLDKVETLWLSEIEIGDDALRHIASMSHLRTLAVGGRSVTDKELAYLGSLTNLKVLYLDTTSVTGKGFVHLRGLPALRELYLDYSLLSDAWIAELQNIPRLRILSLVGTPITDASVPALKELTSLEELILSDTSITSTGIAELKESLPGCRVYGGNEEGDSGVKDAGEERNITE